MSIVITGAAGFIGGNLSQRLLNEGYHVVGVDSVTDYYDVSIKRAVLGSLAPHPSFDFHELDLAHDDLAPLLKNAEAVVHLAAQPGVRLSWSDQFPVYVQRNLIATQRLLDTFSKRPDVPIHFASSSSVYGDAARYPTTESTPLEPRSPYGVTKVATERIAYSYAKNFGMRTVGLRFFTVYGPGQRPDMATHRLIRAALDGTAFPLFGTGEQLRDFTYVDDVCDAVVALLNREVSVGMTPLNVGGTGETSMLALIAAVEQSTGRSIRIDALPAQAGDVFRTGADITAIQELIGWAPSTLLIEGIAAQVESIRARG